MSSEIYQKAFKYEMLIRNTFNCSSSMKNGAHMCFMQNAMTMEEGKTFAKHLGSFQKQFNVVKNYISKALSKLSNTKLYGEDCIFFQMQQQQLENATTTYELMKIVESSLNKIIEYKKS